MLNCTGYSIYFFICISYIGIYVLTMELLNYEKSCDNNLRNSLGVFGYIGWGVSVISKNL